MATRREILMGAASAIAAVSKCAAAETRVAIPSQRMGAATATRAAEPPQEARGAAATEHSPKRAAPRFDPDAFAEDCRRANAGGGASSQAAVAEVLRRAMSNTRAVLTGVGEPTKGGIVPLYRSPDLTILNVTWSPLMQLMPHEHNMWSVIGIYTGREDNIFWEPQESRVSARRASAIMEGDVLELPRDVIHSVSNPIERLTGALHIYGGDFFATPRREWDPATLAPRPWDLQKAIQIFNESNDRFFSWQARKSRG